MRLIYTRSVSGLYSQKECKFILSEYGKIAGFFTAKSYFSRLSTSSAISLRRVNGSVNGGLYCATSTVAPSFT